jgi:hypothetical protein
MHLGYIHTAHKARQHSLVCAGEGHAKIKFVQKLRAFMRRAALLARDCASLTVLKKLHLALKSSNLAPAIP